MRRAGKQAGCAEATGQVQAPFRWRLWRRDDALPELADAMLTAPRAGTLPYLRARDHPVLRQWDAECRCRAGTGMAVKSVSKWRRQFAAERLAGLEDAAPVGGGRRGWCWRWAGEDPPST